MFSRLHQDRKYSTLQSHHFKNDSDYETIKQIHSNITTIVSTNVSAEHTGPLSP